MLKEAIAQIRGPRTGQRSGGTRHGRRGAQAGDGAANGGGVNRLNFPNQVGDLDDPATYQHMLGHLFGPVGGGFLAHQQARFQLRLGARQFGVVNGLAGGAHLVG